MKAYVTTSGERTTDICVSRLTFLGYEVVVLNHKESWYDKFTRFIYMAEEDCLRVDADLILNKNIAVDQLEKLIKIYDKSLMIQFSVYDFYKHDVKEGSPVFYRKEALDKIKKNILKVSRDRPEASSWRLPEINHRTSTVSDRVVGIHGFYQDKEAIDRALQHRIDRKQEHDIDESFIDEVMKLENI